jgi:hypothetical protein
VLCLHIENSAAATCRVDVDRSRPTGSTFSAAVHISVNFHSIDSTLPSTSAMAALFHGCRHSLAKWADSGATSFTIPFLTVAVFPVPR